jgi:guanosine-3',5'-bis(diphosphate) 3'-pyrophosphohydrolase
MTTTHLNGLEPVLDALDFAASKHRDQRRKDANASPYINHPIQLARVLAVEGKIIDEQVIAAAILHDTIEDTETTPDELKQRFGITVASVVEEVTDDKSLPKAVRKQLQIDHAPHVSRRAKLVKLADKICNVRDILESPPADWSHQRKIEYFDWAKKVVDGVRGTAPALEAIFDELYARRPVQ